MKRSIWFILPMIFILVISALVYAFALLTDRAVRYPDTSYKYLIGVSQANLREPWRVTMNEDIRKAAEQNSEIRLIFTDAAMDTQRQVKDIQMLLGYEIDLLIISPNDSIILAPFISEVQKSTPTIVLDRNMAGSDHSLYIGPDNLRIGQLAGEYILKMLGSSGGNIVEILGRADSPSSQLRSEGFHAALEKFPRCRITAQLTANWMQDQAEDRTKEYLIITQQAIDVIFAQNDSMAFGSSIAFDKLRVKRAPIVGVDGLAGVNGGIELVKNRTLSATITCPTGGAQAIEYALRILKGEKNLPKSIILEPVLIPGD